MSVRVQSERQNDQEAFIMGFSQGFDLAPLWDLVTPPMGGCGLMSIGRQVRRGNGHERRE